MWSKRPVASMSQKVEVYVEAFSELDVGDVIRQMSEWYEKNKSTIKQVLRIDVSHYFQPSDSWIAGITYTKKEKYFNLIPKLQ